MARSVASLGVSVTAKTSKFRKGMKRSRSSLKKFTDAVKGAAIKMAKFTAVVTTGGAVAMVLLTKRSLRTIDVVAKLADRIGATTEAITGLQHAAEITGAGTELMNKSLDVMVKRIGEAAQGSGEAKQAIADLGLDVQKLTKLDATEAFREIAGAFGQIKTQAEKSAIASDIFSRAGLRLVNTLELGKEGLAAMQKEAEVLGISFSRVDAAKIEEANDAIQRLKSVFVGFGNRVAVAVTPHITALANAATDFAKKWGGKFWVAMQLGVNVVIAGVDALLAKLQKATAAVVAMGGKMLGLASTLAAKLGLKNLQHGLIATQSFAQSSATSIAGAETPSLGAFIAKIQKDAQAAAEKVSNQKGKKAGLLGMLLGDLRAVGSDTRKSITSFGEMFGTLAAKGAKRRFFGAFGGLLSRFLGAAGKTGATGGVGSFQEVDLGRVAIGGARGLNKEQKVKDVAVVSAVNKVADAVNGINLGLV